MNNRIEIKRLCLSAVFTVMLVVSAWISFPFFGNVLMTAQTLGVALCGYFLGMGAGSMALGAYLLLGLVGVPVFSGFLGGAGILFGPSGGFLYGFFAILLLCAVGRDKGRVTAWSLGTLGVILCHICGILHFCAVSHVGIAAAFMGVSLPFILKDVLSVVAAHTLSSILKKRFNSLY